MKITWFAGVSTHEELKATYKKLCKQWHPDINPDGEKTMMQINAEYDYIIDNGLIAARTGKNGRTDKATMPTAMKAYRDIIMKTTSMKGITVELCGAWLWFSGATYLYKADLKAAGCYWAPKKMMWYWRPAEIADIHSHGKATMLQIRMKYGSIVLEGKEEQRPAAVTA